MRAVKARAPFARLKDALGVTTVFAVIVAVGLGFAMPWLQMPAPAGAARQRYAPVRDGSARLYARHALTDASASTPVANGWSSQNAAVIPGLRAVTSAQHPRIGQAILAYYSPSDGASPNSERAEDRLKGVQVIEIRERAIDAEIQNGSDITRPDLIRNTTQVMLREPKGDLLIGISYAPTGNDFVLTPPALVLPDDIAPGKTWSSAGQLGAASYRLEGAALQTSRRQTPLGAFDDCIEIELRFTLTATQAIASATRDWYCAGAGLVSSTEYDGVGALISRSEPAVDAASYPPPAGATSHSKPLTDPAAWSVARFSNANLSGSDIESSIAPVGVPGNPSLVLAAAYGGDLIAFDAASDTGDIVWRFHTGGTIYGQPAYDAHRGRLYFGSTDKHLYALDARGLFLWSFETGDNVATRPLIVTTTVPGDTVVFGSEDRRLYALDADTGKPRWIHTAGAAIVSSPSAHDGLVIAGSDDGNVYALDTTTGHERWVYPANASVEAPVTVAGGVAFIASRDGTLAALDADTGEERWSASVGGGLRQAPSIGQGLLAVTDEYGHLIALDIHTGRILWRNVDRMYAGSPLAIDDQFIVATANGALILVDAQGRARREWDTAKLAEPTDTGNRYDFSFGPVVGGDSVWAVNARAILWRLGPGTQR